MTVDWLGRGCFVVVVLVTNWGWVRCLIVGSLIVGSAIFSKNGQKCRVVKTYQEYGGKEFDQIYGGNRRKNGSYFVCVCVV